MISAEMLLLALAGVFATPCQSYDNNGPWESYILSPNSRSFAPQNVTHVSGEVAVERKDESLYSINLRAGSQATLDFGIEVGGLIGFDAVTSADRTPQLSLGFAESPSFIRVISDDTGSTPSMDWDRELNVSLPVGSTRYSMPKERFRGGFRFVTVRAIEDVQILNVTCEIGFAPGTDNLRDYSGYFHTTEDLLNRIWYAGAYTTQTNIAPSDTGRYLPQVRPGWAYNSTLGIGGSILVDGAKRDRAVWPGDLGIAAPTGFLALGKEGLTSWENALETLFYYQNSTTGRFPFAGPATGSFRNGAKSDTYHAWSLISMYDFAIYTANKSWLDNHWSKIVHGLDFIMRGLNNSVGLHQQTERNDWARQGGGGYNSALNALDYRSLSLFSSLALSAPTGNAANRKSKIEQSRKWATAASILKKSYNDILWNPTASLFRDNETSSAATFYPQDGNALALLYGLTTSSGQAIALSDALTGNWNSIGPVTPELPDTISPFISGIEVLAHYAAGKPDTALKLMQMTWGYLLDSPLMTGSTLVEGITANGSLYYRSMAGYRYDASYTSLSHSWSSAPTHALSFKVAGLEIVDWRVWLFAPRPSTLTSAQAGYDSPLGFFQVSWNIDISPGHSEIFAFNASFTTPRGTKGSISLPWRCKKVSLNGKARDLDKHPRIEGGIYVLEALGCRF